MTAASATWEDADVFTAKFPAFQLLLNRRRDEMSCTARAGRAAERAARASDAQGDAETQATLGA
jgi:hypothetical protein